MGRGLSRLERTILWLGYRLERWKKNLDDWLKDLLGAAEEEGYEVPTGVRYHEIRAHLAGWPEKKPEYVCDDWSRQYPFLQREWTDNDNFCRHHVDPKTYNRICASVSRAARRLEKRGLVKRRRGFVEVTDMGIKTARQLKKRDIIARPRSQMAVARAETRDAQSRIKARILKEGCM